MRLIKTLVLRLNIDSEAPERLCGDLQALPKLETLLYKNEDALIAFLHGLVNQELSMKQKIDKPDHLPTQEV